MSELQFDRAEYAGPEASACTFCQAGITQQFFTINGRTACPTCHHHLAAARNQGTPGSRFFTAAGWGLLAAIGGAGIFYAVREITGYELGLVAVVVGLAVGKGVQRGARGRGGAGYQTLAIALTYISIAMNYAPYLIEGMSKTLDGKPHGSIASVIVGVLTAGLIVASPILVAVKAPFSLVINGIALYEAWKINKRVPFAVTGPHAVAAAAPPPPAPEAPAKDG